MSCLSHETPLQPPGSWKWRKRQLRNLLLVAVVLVALAHTVGAPHLRWEYRYRGPRSAPTILSGVYVGPTGVQRVSAADRECSLILFLKPERPLWGWLDSFKEGSP